MSLSAAQRAELEAKHGREIIEVNKPGHDTLVFRKPDLPIWDRYEASSAAGDQWGAIEKVCEDCLVFPEKEGKPDTAKFEALLEDFPGVAGLLQQKLSALAGYDERSFVKRDDGSHIVGIGGYVVSLGKHPPCLFKKPTRAIWGQFQFATRREESNTAGPMMKLLEECLVAPSKDGKPDTSLLGPMWHDYPSARALLFSKLAALAGHNEDGLGKP